MNKYYMQDEAKKLSGLFPDSAKLKLIADNCCCASVALWIMGVDEKSHLEIIADELGKGLNEECSVYWMPFFNNVAGRKIRVEFRDIKNLADLKDVKGRCAVRFSDNKNQHWVGVQNCKVEYNSIKNSNCVTNGKPVEARIITFV